MAQYSGCAHAGINLNCGRNEIEEPYIASEHEERKGLRIKCMDCGYQWATKSESPRCPRCKSYEIMEDDDYGLGEN